MSALGYSILLKVTDVTLAELRYKQAQLIREAAVVRSRWRTMPTGPRALAAGKRAADLEKRAADYELILGVIDSGQ